MDILSDARGEKPTPVGVHERKVGVFPIRWCEVRSSVIRHRELSGPVRVPSFGIQSNLDAILEARKVVEDRFASCWILVVCTEHFATYEGHNCTKNEHINCCFAR